MPASPHHPAPHVIGLVCRSIREDRRNTGRVLLVVPMVIAWAVAIMALPAHGQARWPSRPVTVIVPNAPGGFTDIMARLAAQRLSIKFAQPFIVENRAGGAGVIGATQVANAQ